MISLAASKVTEMKFPLSHAPTDCRFSKEEWKDRFGDCFELSDRDALSTVAAWNKAKSQLGIVSGYAERMLEFHDNDYGAVGKYDRCHQPGVMDVHDSTQTIDSTMEGRTQSLALPTHFWQKRKSAPAVTEFSQKDYRKEDHQLCFERDYQAAYSDEKFPKMTWEQATVVHSGASGSFLRVAADYLNDQLIVQCGKSIT